MQKIICNSFLFLICLTLVVSACGETRSSTETPSIVHPITPTRTTVPITLTPTSTEIPATVEPCVSLFDLFRDPSLGRTVPVLSLQDAEAAFGENFSLQSISSQVAFNVAQIHAANAFSIIRVIVPEYIRIADIENYLAGLGIERVNFTIENFASGMNMDDDHTLLISIHAGQEGWTTAFWRGPVVSQRSDGSAMIDGEMMLVVDTNGDEEEKSLGLYSLPGGMIRGTHTDVAIVDGCPPGIIREQGEQIQAIVRPDFNSADILLPNSLWIINTELVITSTPEVLHDWNFVSQHTDDEIFQTVGVPNPSEYRLEIELFPYRILRNEGGQSYALYANSEGIVFLSKNLETGETLHTIYAEYNVRGRRGVPVMLVTDQSVIEQDNLWFGLNQEYGLEDARDRFAEAVMRALAYRKWSLDHPMDISDIYGWPSLDEIPGFNSGMNYAYFTKNQRMQISNFMLENFLLQLEDVRNNGNPFPLELADRGRSVFDAAGDTLVIRPVVNDDMYWADYYNGISTDNGYYPFIGSQRSGSVFALELNQPNFNPFRDPATQVGGQISHFLRYFFGRPYFLRTTESAVGLLESDMTGPIIDTLCRPGSIPSLITDGFLYSYPTQFNSRSMLQDCAVNITFSP